MLFLGVEGGVGGGEQGGLSGRFSCVGQSGHEEHAGGGGESGISSLTARATHLASIGHQLPSRVMTSSVVVPFAWRTFTAPASPDAVS